MKKAIERELLMIALLALVIVLTLRMVIYDFIPNENTLPESIEYSADPVVEATLREIQMEEASYNITGNSTTESLLKSYVIEETDLKEYVSKKEYRNGKIDPFANYVETNKSKKTSSTNR